MTAAVHAQTHTIGPTPRRGRAPSLGFLCVCATYIGVLAFLGYGLRTPDLDRIWTLHHELKLGLRGAPRGAERELLERALERHPELAGALLSEGDIGLISRNSDGWITTPEATIVRTATAPERVLHFEVETPRDLLPFRIEVSGRGHRQQLDVKQRGSYDVTLPPPHAAELIIVRLKGRDLRDDPSVLGVQIGFARERGR
jgi:hypothetical protein